MSSIDEDFDAERREYAKDVAKLRKNLIKVSLLFRSQTKSAERKNVSSIFQPLELTNIKLRLSIYA